MPWRKYELSPSLSRVKRERESNFFAYQRKYELSTSLSRVKRERESKFSEYQRKYELSPSPFGASSIQKFQRAMTLGQGLPRVSRNKLGYFGPVLTRQKFAHVLFIC